MNDLITMRDEVYSKMRPVLDDLVNITRKRIEEVTDGHEEINIDRVIHILDRFKENYPDQKIIVEAPNGSSFEVKICEAMIYEGNNGELVIDTE